LARTVFEKSDVVPLVAETFRELGYEGASFSRITQRTGLGKGSLYHFFPGGKEEMAATVLAEIDAWFIENIFEPLERHAPEVAIAQMWTEVEAYFQSGQRICLVGAFALDATRERFAPSIERYFTRWIEALGSTLIRSGRDTDTAKNLAEDIVLSLQGALVLARAMRNNKIFSRTLTRLKITLDQNAPPSLYPQR
jgi:TetR/AcrR family transcriptional regulator, lmrAB and yxaGH operons repressor